MAENEQAPEGNVSRGADWEVVSLTASTYAAAPGPAGTEKPPDSHDEKKSSSALLSSDQFVFPPSEHENLPIETNYIGESEEGKSDDEIVIQGLKSNVDAHRIQYFDQGKDISAQDLEDKEGDDIDDGDEALDDDDGDGGDDDDDDDDDSARGVLEATADYDEAPTNFPHVLWWKRHVTRYYLQAKESSAFWPVVVAAALVGLAILGHKLHQNKSPLLQLKGH